MNRKTLAFVALAISMLYGVGFAVFDDPPQGYAAVGAVVVALSWIAVGTFGRDEEEPPAAVAPSTLESPPTTDPTAHQVAPWGTSTEDAPRPDDR